MSKGPTWIWYPGDFEIWLGNKFNNRRTERGAMFPPFWKQDSHYPTVEFSTTVSLERDEFIEVWAEGEFNFSLDGKLLSALSAPNLYWDRSDNERRHVKILIPRGDHSLNVKVWNQLTPPALFVDGTTVKTNRSWKATYEDKLWIDENGVAHGSGIYVPADSWNFNSYLFPPSSYHLAYRDLLPVSQEQVGEGTLYDFGRESFGHLVLVKEGGFGRACIYYGESREEALDTAHCETLDGGEFSLQDDLRKPLASKAFRYVYVTQDPTLHVRLLAYEEYAETDPQHAGTFSCSDDELNRIWQTAAYTLELTTQEFFMDGIKRDRWVWSGDAIQSYLMNYYLHFDTECVKRTIRLLRGKDPVTSHVNTIMDYTFYWFKSILDYYHYTGDKDFVSEMYPRMQTLMDYVTARLTTDGLAEGRPDDWIFVDWVDFPMHKRGTLCFEQMLLCKAQETMVHCAALVGDREGKERYHRAYVKSRYLIHTHFWSSEKHAYLHALEDGQLNPQVTKFPNMLAILFDYADDETKEELMQHVMLNPDTPPITTPYMRFYELEALCQRGLHTQVLKEIRDYWGGMLREGATSFWEKYNPEEKGTEHLAMYGRPYGKSLCHAWGASPVYLLGRYYLGVQPAKEGYAEFEATPHLGDLDWMEGTVPTPRGLIHVRMDRHTVNILSTTDPGWLNINGERHKVTPGKPLTLNIE